MHLPCVCDVSLLLLGTHSGFPSPHLASTVVRSRDELVAGLVEGAICQRQNVGPQYLTEIAAAGKNRLAGADETRKRSGWSGVEFGIWLVTAFERTWRGFAVGGVLVTRPRRLLASRPGGG